MAKTSGKAQSKWIDVEGGIGKKFNWHIRLSARVISPILKLFDGSRDIGDLLIRFWIARIFFLSGMSKIASWPTTIVLFKYDYAVPLLSQTSAAYIGTAAEFILPVLLLLGLGGRLSIFAFFIYNAICMLSFSFLWTPAGTAGLDSHVIWGLLLLMLMLHGPGRLSLDYLIHRRYGHLLYRSIKVTRGKR